MANKKNAKSKKVVKKVVPVVPREMKIEQNMTGQSESFDKAVEASVTLLSHYYHTTLKKYVTEDGNIVDSISIPGQGEGEEAITISGVDSLAFDLQKLTNLALQVNNLQRLRQDDALNIGLNPLNTNG